VTLLIADTTIVNIYAQLVTLYAGLADMHREVQEIWANAHKMCESQ